MAPRFIREIVTATGDKIAVKIDPDNDNTVVALVDPGLNYAVTLGPAAAHDLGRALIHAARIAAFNAVTNKPKDPFREGEMH